MNRKSKISWKNKYLPKKLCSEYFASKKCKPCKKHKSLRNRFKKSRKDPNYKPTEKQIKKAREIIFKVC